jgi:catechol 2,3-dioxygenase-like lactoylglutathione lyase family enzyme
MTISKKDNMMVIIYVKDQEKSKSFYENLLGYKPKLDVPGMTEFQLLDNIILGIMPEEGIMRILENKIPNPNSAYGIPRSEIYLFVDEPDEYYFRLVDSGGNGISKAELRNWGDYVAYGSDLDGHILAFAKKV